MKPATDAERAEMYRRQLGGMTAAHARLKRRVRELEAEVAELRAGRGADGSRPRGERSGRWASTSQNATKS